MASALMKEGRVSVLAVLLFLLLVAILFGLGVAVHLFWIIAIVALALWLLGFLFRPHGGRWYRW